MTYIHKFTALKGTSEERVWCTKTNIKESLLVYAFDTDIPFTHNLAERDLLPLKIKMKVFYAFTSTEGANYPARIEGLASSFRKQNINIFSALIDIFDGNKFTIDL